MYFCTISLVYIEIEIKYRRLRQTQENGSLNDKFFSRNMDYIPLASDSDSETECHHENNIDTHYGLESYISDASDIENYEGPLPHVDREVSTTFHCRVAAFKNCKICHTERTLGCILPCCQYKKFLCFECMVSLFISASTDKYRLPHFVLQTCIPHALDFVAYMCPFCRSNIKSQFKGEILYILNQIILSKLTSKSNFCCE